MTQRLDKKAERRRVTRELRNAQGFLHLAVMDATDYLHRLERKRGIKPAALTVRVTTPGRRDATWKSWVLLHLWLRYAQHCMTADEFRNRAGRAGFRFTRSTLYDWKRKFAGGGVRALVDRRGALPSGTAVDAELWRELRRRTADGARIAPTARMLAEKAASEGRKWPSVRTIQRAVKSGRVRMLLGKQRQR